MGYQLIIFDNPEVRKVAAEAVAIGKSPTECDIRQCENILDAEAVIARFGVQSCNLVIVGSSTPADACSARAQPTRDATTHFIRKLKKDQPHLRVVVLSAVPDQFLAGFLEAYEETALLQFDSQLRDALIREAIARPNDERGVHSDYLELDIFLDDCESGRWSMRRRGRMNYEDEGKLPLDRKMFEKIVRHSSILDGDVEHKIWKVIMTDLSEELEELLFKNANALFWGKFVAARTESGGLERTWIRFGVNEQTQDAFLEALKEESDQEHWMLKVPIFRKYPPAGRRLPLFKDIASRQGSINCLIIEADAQGGIVNFAGRDISLQSLSKTQEETERIESILAQACQTDNGRGVVKRVRISEAVGLRVDPRTYVLDVLRGGNWNLVHFAGHAVQSVKPEESAGAARSPTATARGQRAAQAALVLSADQDCVLPIEMFCQHLGATQFLFLSCCRSAESSLIMRLTEKLVPAVLGYRWRVDDAGASDFADFFYTELFNRTNSHYKYLEYAFRDARRKLYDRNNDDPTWASPMLVLQMKQAEVAY
jgi:hypothetical protein